jgi:membrane fusion protein (multidrug efflux system)
MRKAQIKFLFIFLFFLLVGIEGCKKKKTGLLEMNSKGPLPVDVYVVPNPSEVKIDLEYPATTRAYQKVIVCAKITGTLEKVFFKEGSVVKKGSPLFEIEKDIYEAKYESAKAAYLQALAQLDNAQRTWKRIKRAFRAKLVSEETRDKALSQLKLAEASVKLAKARLKEAQIYLDYTLVKAPISGIVGERLVDPGNLVTPGKPLVKLEQIQPIYVDFSIPDRDLFKYHFLSSESPNYFSKLKLMLKTSSGKIFPEEGKIVYFSSELSQNVPVLKVKAEFPNKEMKLLPNSFVRVILKDVEVGKAILVPQKSVLYSPEGEKVFVVEGSKAVERLIKTVGTYKDYYVVEKGLKPGEKVVVSNLMRLTSGEEVKVEKIVNR